ncbi:MAG TPA: nucleoside/nucleotide kinase family protein [Nocardioidaceae bacterium]|nr:nucleoside/nucleotide kinase family protein [Nocardioidaceae bacterium]
MTQPPTSLEALRDRAMALVAGDRRAILGIAGPPGAGKSTLARAVADAVDAVRPGWAAYVPMDGFHLADVQLARLGLLDRKGAPETFDVDGYAVLLERLRADDEPVVYAPGFERDIVDQPIAARIAVLKAARLIVTEGNYLLASDRGWPRVRAALDETWYCDLGDAARVERLVARHVQFGKPPADARRWVLRSDEANAALVADSRHGADLVVEMASFPAHCA